MLNGQPMTSRQRVAVVLGAVLVLGIVAVLVLLMPPLTQLGLPG